MPISALPAASSCCSLASPEDAEFLDIEPVLGEDSHLHADIERRESPGKWYDLGDTKFFLGGPCRREPCCERKRRTTRQAGQQASARYPSHRFLPMFFLREICQIIAEFLAYGHATRSGRLALTQPRH